MNVNTVKEFHSVTEVDYRTGKYIVKMLIAVPYNEHPEYISNIQVELKVYLNNHEFDYFEISEIDIPDEMKPGFDSHKFYQNIEKKFNEVFFG